MPGYPPKAFTTLPSLLLSVRFATTVAQRSQLPRPDVPEIAFVGRSNAGKSSAINTITQRRRLAFSSKTPGRTQALNFFALGRETDPPVAYLVDTPGYGYAATPHAVREGWAPLAGHYLANRESLAGIVLVLDSRRGLTALDRQLLGFARADVPLLALLTKSDKLGFAERRRTEAEVSRALDVAACQSDLTLISFSANTSLGLEPARGLLEEWLEAERQKKSPAG